MRGIGCAYFRSMKNCPDPDLGNLRFNTPTSSLSLGEASYQVRTKVIAVFEFVSIS